MTKRIVIAGSSSLQEEMKKWVDFWNAEPNYQVIDWPNPVDSREFKRVYPKVYQEFYKNMTLADSIFIANEDKHGVRGYIGAETFAELAFAVAQNLVYGRNIKIILAKMPSEKVQSIDEIKLWLELGWIKIYDE